MLLGNMTKMLGFFDLQLAAKATWLAASAGRMYLAKDILFLLICVRWLIDGCSMEVVVVIFASSRGNEVRDKSVASEKQNSCGLRTNG
jgi:hypothetical protein